MADPTTPPPPRIAAHPLLNLPPTMSVGALNSDHVNRMINSAHTPSPSRTICSDRFIPSRSSSNFALFNLPPSPSVSSSTPDGKDDVGSSSSSAYTALLRAALFGPDTPDRKDAPGASNNIFRYKTETKRSLQSLYPFGFEEADTTVVPNPVKAPRKVPRSPYKVLDAPALQDDFYLNLVDWSSHNVLAVGLGNCVYLWNACSSKVTKLCDLGIDDSVCSVGWAQRGTQLAVGTSNGKVQIWDAARCRNVRTMEGHRLRVGSLAWSSSLLSTGSRDKCILQRDIRTQDEFVSKLSGHKSEVCGLKWSYDNRELASGGNDNRLFVWNQHSTQPVLKYCEHTAAVKAIAWSPHIRGLLASGGGTADRCIRFWNTSANSHLSCIDTGSQVCNLVWSKNVNELVSTHGYSQNQVIVWRYPTMSKMDRRLLLEQAMKRLDFGTYFRLPNLRTIRARLEHFHLEEQLFVDFYSSSNLVVLHNTVNVEALDRCVKFSTASCPFPLLVQVENYMLRDQMDTTCHLKIDNAAMYGGILLQLCFLPFVVYLACHALYSGFLNYSLLCKYYSEDSHSFWVMNQIKTQNLLPIEFKDLSCSVSVLFCSRQLPCFILWRKKYQIISFLTMNTKQITDIEGQPIINVYLCMYNVNNNKV